MKRLFYIVSAILLLQACAASRNVRQNPDLGRAQDGNFKIEMQEIVTSDGEVHNAYGSYMAVYGDGTGTLDISPLLSSKRLDLLKLFDVPVKMENIRSLRNGDITFDITFCDNVPLKERVFSVTLHNKSNTCRIFSRTGYTKRDYIYIDGTFVSSGM